MAKIIFSGGGTLGPVVPLLAVAEIIRKRYPQTEMVWVGTKDGPEKELVEKYNIRFTSITAGKLRRYFSLFNLVDLFKLKIGFFKALFFLHQEKPDLLITCGGFVSVPLHWAGAVLKIKSWVHQQDARVGLANKLMAPFADIVTVALRDNLKRFNQKKVTWLGNPVRADIFLGDKARARQLFGLNTDLPVVFATGGGTGSLRVNQIMVEAAAHLKGICEVIHLSGKERPQKIVDYAAKIFDFYHHFQFFTHEMADAYAVADIVVSRAGFSTICEAAALNKPIILVPKPGHQYENVKFLEAAGAAVFLDERVADGNQLAGVIKEILRDEIKKRQLADNLRQILPPAEENKILEIVSRLVSSV